MIGRGPILALSLSDRLVELARTNKEQIVFFWQGGWEGGARMKTYISSSFLPISRSLFQEPEVLARRGQDEWSRAYQKEY
jgi:hypothetical protein